MGLKLTTDDKPVKVFVSEKDGKNGKFSTYSIGTSSKDQEGVWIKAYIDVAFKKDALKPMNQQDIIIKNAFPSVSEYNGKKYIKWIITDFDIVGENVATVTGNEGFMQVTDEGSLPFAPISRR